MEGSKYFPRSKPPCPLSDPANSHKLCRRSDPPLSKCFACKSPHLVEKRYFYYCATCDLEFQRGCHILPPEIRHPFHLLHPLTLLYLGSDKFDSFLLPINWDDSSSDSENDEFEAYRKHKDCGSGESHQKCKSCRKVVDDKLPLPYYHCSICNFSLHFTCVINRPPLTIENLKSHDHTLTLFPRRLPLPCDACGISLDTFFEGVYSCLKCNYMVHRRCIYLPRVIKITRHPHRLSHTSSIIPVGEFSCGVCRKLVDVNYGNYSCNKGCHYTVHSKCATKDEVWDGKDLEGVPEEEEEEDVEPFVRIDQETIKHFSHDHHHLKIHWNGNHENKFCQACILLITGLDRVYSCIQCDFVLHEACASLPRKIYHPIHKHPLVLFHPFSPNPHELENEYHREGLFSCDGCHFQLEARCALLPDPLFHDCHPHDHPLSFNLTIGDCIACNYGYFDRKFLECIKCNSFLCLQCATLPSVAHYKHDKHPLTLCYGEEETTDWCEICETKVDATKWFYTCNSCRVTLHVTCLLGKEMYMKTNHHIIRYGKVVDIIRNSGQSRPVCDECTSRCVDTLVFKKADEIFCSWCCILNHRV